MTFKVGDKIRGTSDNHIVLDARMKLAEVIELFKVRGSTEGMVIKIIEHTDKTKIGLKYWVYNLDIGFELVEEKKMDKLEELKKKYKELGEEIERLKEEQAHKPKYGEDYSFIRYDNEVISNIWYADDIDEARYELGNAFRTQEEAEFRAEQLKVEAKLRRFARPFEENEQNVILKYTHDTNKLLTGHHLYSQYGNIYFASEEIAQKAIDTVGEERIKKYYFGINE